MPYQRKNKDLITISPTVDRILYSAIQARGYSVSEIINMAFSAVLEMDMEYMIRFEVLQKAKERLEATDYRDMIERAKARQEERKRLEAEAAAKKELHDKILNIIIENFRPNSPEKIRSLEFDFQERCWSASSVDFLLKRIEQYFSGSEYNVDFNQAVDFLREAISCKWMVKKEL